jgi:putative sterol carrier protein
MTYEELLAAVKSAAGKADGSSVKKHLAVQFNIEGDAAGTFYLEVRDGKIMVEPYDYKDRDILVTCKAETLLGILAGKTDVIGAYLTRKLKAEGDLGRANDLKAIIKGGK